MKNSVFLNRSCLLTLPYALLFKMLSVLRLDYQILVVLMPKFLAGLFTAVSDYSLYILVKMKNGSYTASWFLLLSQTNWFLLYSGSRTLVNTTETSLLSIGLLLYPRNSYLLVVALSVMVRPTIVIVWIPLILVHVWRILNQHGIVSLMVKIPLPSFVIALTVLTDSIFYGKFTVTPYNFFMVNVVHNLGSFYGTNPVYWYLTNALVPILGPLLPVSMISMVSRRYNNLLWPVWTSLIFLSMLEHKEMRFIQPVVPLLLYAASLQLYTWYRSAPSSTWLVMSTIINIPLALYLSLVHQRGVTDVAMWLGHQPNITSAMYLMPCHSAPMYSHTHRDDIQLGYLTCLPNLKLSEDYIEEAEIFYSNPAKVLVNNFNSFQCLIMFDSLSDMNEKIFSSKYKLIQSIFHSHVSSGRVGKSILIYCK